jgi:hypothetical protein
MIKGNGIDVNTSANIEGVKAAKEAILELLNAKADQETIRMALECLKNSVQPGSSVISNCVVNGGGSTGIDGSDTCGDEEESGEIVERN